MKKLILILFLASLASAPATAQNTPEVYMPQVVEGDNFYSSFSKIPIISSLQRLAVDANQLAIVRQDGAGNSAELSQQNGVNNVAAIFMDGSNNSATMSQSGSGLLSVLNIRGNANEMDMQQAGNFLQNYVQVTGNSIEMDIKQNAEGIQLTQFGGEGAIPLRITQSSGSVPIIINN